METETYIFNISTPEFDRNSLTPLYREPERSVIKYLHPPLVIFGMTGNILAAVILQSSTFRKMRASFILTCLAVIDTIALCFPAFIWIFVMANLEWNELHPAVCMIVLYWLHLCGYLSAYTLILFVVERLISVVSPIHAKHICTKHRIKIAWVIMVCVMALWNSHVFWQATTTELEGRLHCILKPSNVIFGKIQRLVDLIFGPVLPFLFMTTSSIVVLAKLQHQSKLIASKPRQMTENKGITVMLLLACLTYIVSMMPVVIFLALYSLHQLNLAPDDFNLIYACLRLVFYVNHAVNFLLYCMSGKYFREALVSVFRKCRFLTRSRTESGSHNLPGHTSSDTHSSRL